MASLFASAWDMVYPCSWTVIVLSTIVVSIFLHYVWFWYTVRNGVQMSGPPVKYPFGNLDLFDAGVLRLCERMQGSIDD